MAMTGQQIYENFVNGPGTAGLEGARDKLLDLQVRYEALATRFLTAGQKVEAGWTGPASGAAQRGVGPLAEEHVLASAEMQSAVELLDSQVEGFHRAKNSVEPVPPLPQSPPTMADVFADGGTNYEDQVGSHLASAAKNLTVMDGWGTTSSTNSNMPTSYGDIGKLGASVGMAQPGGGEVQPLGGGFGGSGPNTYSGSGSGSGSGGGYSAGGPGAPGGFDGPGGAGLGSSPGGSYSAPGSTGGVNVPAASGSGSRGSSYIPGDDTTSTSGYTPPSTVSGVGSGTPGWSSNVGAIGGDGAAGGGRAGGSVGGFAGGGAGGYAGGGAAGGGAGSGSGGKLGAGKVTGVAPPGGGTTGGTPTSSTAGGASRSSGRMPMGGMGAGGRGKGGEDEEHERKYIQDDDAAFELTEPGEKVVDPNTGMPVTPSVLGESAPKKQQ